MYSFITKKPSKNEIKVFNIIEHSNENFINYRIDPRDLSVGEKELLITTFQLDNKVSNYNDFIFLTLPLNNNSYSDNKDLINE